MYRAEIPSSCLINSVTENLSQKEILSFEWVGGPGGGAGCLKITVTENGAKLWSVTLQGGKALEPQVRRQMMSTFGGHYRNLTSKTERARFLSSIGPLLNMNRKSLIRALNRQESNDRRRGAGRPRKYTDIDLAQLKILWSQMGFPCGKRMQASLPEWLPFFSCADQVKGSLLKMSAATIDRNLEAARLASARKRNVGTVPAKYKIKQTIPLRDPKYRPTVPGEVETDTVVHCGDYIWGQFANTVTATDLLSGWTTARSINGKDAEKTITALKSVETKLPFDLLALYFDNGMEFINYRMVQEFQMREKKPVKTERGRKGKSNDQCHVEQKNNHFVRQLFGYQRIETQEIVDMMNDLYENEWTLLYNYFMPQMKLIEKDRIGSKIKRKYDKPKTPYQRLMECEAFSEEKKKELRKIKEGLNPFELQKAVQSKVHAINEAIKAHEKKKQAS